MAERAHDAKIGRGGKRTIRIWSAGCSSGEEAYSIAIVLWEAGLVPSHPQFTFEIVGTDVNTKVLEEARRGVYSTRSVRNIEGPLPSPAFPPRWLALRHRRGAQGLRAVRVRQPRADADAVHRPAGHRVLQERGDLFPAGRQAPPCGRPARHAWPTAAIWCAAMPSRCSGWTKASPWWSTTAPTHIERRGRTQRSFVPSWPRDAKKAPDPFPPSPIAIKTAVAAFCAGDLARAEAGARRAGGRVAARAARASAARHDCRAPAAHRRRRFSRCAARSIWTSSLALAHFWLGNLYRDRGELDRARCAYENVIRGWDEQTLSLTEELATDLSSEQLVAFCSDTLQRLTNGTNG